MIRISVLGLDSPIEDLGDDKSFVKFLDWVDARQQYGFIAILQFLEDGPHADRAINLLREAWPNITFYLSLDAPRLADGHPLLDQGASLIKEASLIISMMDGSV